MTDYRETLIAIATLVFSATIMISVAIFGYYVTGWIYTIWNPEED